VTTAPAADCDMKSTMALVLRPSAKINLTLHVGGVRADGYHDVRTVMQSIAVTDRLTLTPRRGPFALATSSPGVPEDQSNLVYRAAEVLWRAIGRTGEPRDVHVRLVKEIPVAAGLGGGSADAAAALAGLNVVWNGRLPMRELMALGATLGSDVPFFFVGGTALAAGRGEELYPLDDLPRLTVVVIKPSFGVSAADAYAWLEHDRRASSGATGRRPAEIEVGWPAGPLVLSNDLEAPVAARHPVVGEMLAALTAAGGRAAMTGSGSAVFAVFPREVSSAALAKLRRPDWLVLVTRTASRRETLRRGGL
jgi:4-diphosphocytidyl-2-C-methyl-D-erythritol kinase